MTSQTTDKKNKAFLLKMIMVVDIMPEAYRYITRDLNFIKTVEEDRSKTLPAEVVNTSQDKAEKILNIIRTPPSSGEISIPLSEVFNQVGQFEEPEPETIEFNVLARTDPVKAIKFLSTIDYDFDARVNALVAEVSQGVTQLNPTPQDQTSAEQITIINTLKNNIETSFLLLKEYGIKDQYQESLKLLFPQYFTSLWLVRDKLISLFNDNEPVIFQQAMRYADDSFINEYIATKDLVQLDELIKGSDKEYLFKSRNINKLLERVASFLSEATFDDVLKVTQETSLLEINDPITLHEAYLNYLKLSTSTAHKTAFESLIKQQNILSNIRSSEHLITTYVTSLKEIRNKIPKTGLWTAEYRLKRDITKLINDLEAQNGGK